MGVLQKVHVYDVFVDGAKDGLKTVVEILPTLIGLMVAGWGIACKWIFRFPFLNY